MVTADDVRFFARPLPRSEEVYVRDRLKFRVRGIVYLALSRDETILGFGFPKLSRADLIASEPEKFVLPRHSDLRFNWVEARMSVLDRVELGEIVLDAWRLVVPKFLAARYDC